MTSKVAFVKQKNNWFAMIPKLLLLAILCFFYYWVDQTQFFIYATATYIVLLLIARKIFYPPAMFEAMKYFKDEKFEEAVPLLNDCLAFYTQKPWIDKYRFWLQISSSEFGIAEMCLCNLAYCNVRLGNIEAAREMYQGVLNKNSKNTVALSMIATIDAISLPQMGRSIH